MVVVISDEYLESDACDFQTKFALSLSPGELYFLLVSKFIYKSKFVSYIFLSFFSHLLLCMHLPL